MCSEVIFGICAGILNFNFFHSRKIVLTHDQLNRFTDSLRKMQLDLRIFLEEELPKKSALRNLEKDTNNMNIFIGSLISVMIKSKKDCITLVEYIRDNEDVKQCFTDMYCKNLPLLF